MTLPAVISFPEAGKTYTINHIHQNGVLTAYGNDVRLVPYDEDGSESEKWKCDLTNDGFGFVNVKIGYYLGMNGDRRLANKAAEQNRWESFIFQPTKWDGYQFIVNFKEHNNNLYLPHTGENQLVTTPSLKNIDTRVNFHKL
ncbi:hypothetical protein PENFLA_c071G01311 [Penicillium flavigenum]|uniref:Ricin B lectin domain-containing protein n=1 Tax=Penicillium flavigenum TaxID=254877 RepID=A0A1V6SCW6_9EURO|nr:hypothetical protein PENFLA_c071G01311 [Penicillium flavigenum]